MFLCILIGIEIIAVAVGKDIDINALRKFVKNAEDMILPLSGPAIGSFEIARSAAQKACKFVGKSKSAQRLSVF